MRQNIMLGGLIVLLVFSVIVMSSCAGSRNDSISGDAGFAGDSESTLTGDTTTTETDEDEVLRLLGLSEEGESTTSPTESSTSLATDSELQQRVNDLQQQVEEKEVQVANLQAELAERDRRLEELQKESTRQPTSSSTSSTLAVSGTFKERYDRGLQIYNNREYRQALRVFSDLLATPGSDNLKDNCQYWKGECYYGLGEYNQAIIEFEKVFAYHNSNKYDDSQLKLGLCYLQLGNREKANREFQKLLDNYPDSEYISKARYYLGQ